MLFAFEGPPAVGKTRWIQEFPAHHSMPVLPEEVPPEPLSLESVAARVAWNTERWEGLREIENRYGRAYADTDPLGLWRSFALTVIGETNRSLFEEAFRLYREAMARERIGFVDHVVLLTASPDKLTERHEADADRERPHFESHRMLGGPIEAYYTHLETLRPGTVNVVNAEMEVRKTGVTVVYRLVRHDHPRYDVAALDALKDALDLLIPALIA